jgi:hypothetical protein
LSAPEQQNTFPVGWLKHCSHFVTHDNAMSVQYRHYKVPSGTVTVIIEQFSGLQILSERESEIG